MLGILTYEADASKLDDLDEKVGTCQAAVLHD